MKCWVIYQQSGGFKGPPPSLLQLVGLTHKVRAPTEELSLSHCPYLLGLSSSGKAAALLVKM